MQTTGQRAGPPLPAEVQGRLFGAMISSRPDRAGPRNDGPHLGLGLYIARLVAEFHGGTIDAANLADGGGVAVTVTLPLAAG